jgi:hypothetical protein
LLDACFFGTYSTEIQKQKLRPLSLRASKCTLAYGLGVFLFELLFEFFGRNRVVFYFGTTRRREGDDEPEKD